MSEKLKHYVHQFVKPDEQAWEAFLAKLTYQDFPKNQLLVKSGEICKFIYFIESGMARHYYDFEGYEGTVWFSFEGDLLTEVSSFTLQQPAQHNILSLTPLRVWRMSHQDLQDLYQSYHIWERFGRLTGENYLIRVTARSYDLLFKDARTRYEELVAQSPQLVQQIPLNIIAQYLGIAVETLSRIRSNRYNL